MNEDLFKIFLSIALGGAVGLEREFNDKPAGLRTNLLICLGSTLFTIFSAKMAVGTPMADPTRIAAQIVTGIGFLGAGAILREGTHVIGLTTAATIWVVAAIGTGVGCGHYALSALAAFGTLLVQVLFSQLDILIDSLHQRTSFRIVAAPSSEALERVDKAFGEARVRILNRKVMKREGAFLTEWLTVGSRRQHQKLLEKLLSLEGIREVTY